ncbi:unnamed protein product [Closterium sp. Yama58-4]|nr:unnamed protein product [Closterium sp. Yama58-4]
MTTHQKRALCLVIHSVPNLSSLFLAKALLQAWGTPVFESMVRKIRNHSDWWMNIPKGKEEEFRVRGKRWDWKKKKYFKVEGGVDGWVQCERLEAALLRWIEAIGAGELVRKGRIKEGVFVMEGEEGGGEERQRGAWGRDGSWPGEFNRTSPMTAGNAAAQQRQGFSGRDGSWAGALNLPRAFEAPQKGFSGRDGSWAAAGNLRLRVPPGFPGSRASGPLNPRAPNFPGTRAPVMGTEEWQQRLQGQHRSTFESAQNLTVDSRAAVMGSEQWQQRLQRPLGGVGSWAGGFTAAPSLGTGLNRSPHTPGHTFPGPQAAALTPNAGPAGPTTRGKRLPKCVVRQDQRGGGGGGEWLGGVPGGSAAFPYSSRNASAYMYERGERAFGGSEWAFEAPQKQAEKRSKKRNASFHTAWSMLVGGAAVGETQKNAEGGVETTRNTVQVGGDVGGETFESTQKKNAEGGVETTRNTVQVGGDVEGETDGEGGDTERQAGGEGGEMGGSDVERGGSDVERGGSDVERGGSDMERGGGDGEGGDGDGEGGNIDPVLMAHNGWENGGDEEERGGGEGERSGGEGARSGGEGERSGGEGERSGGEGERSGGEGERSGGEGERSGGEGERSGGEGEKDGRRGENDSRERDRDGTRGVKSGNRNGGERGGKGRKTEMIEVLVKEEELSGSSESRSESESEEGSRDKVEKRKEKGEETREKKREEEW